jgi:hypothetical protein
MSVMLIKRREAEEFCVMALELILDAVENAGLSEEAVKAAKKTPEGKYIIEVIPVTDVTKLQSALSKERENSRKAEDQLKTFENLDPAKAREAMKKVEEMANWTPEQKVKEQIEAVKASIIEAHGKEKAKLEEKLSKLTKSLEEAMIVSVASQALAEQKGSVRLLMPHIRQQTRLREADGKFIVEVLGADGNPRLVGADGHPMAINELVSEMKTQNDFASAFEGTGATGSGAAGSSGTGVKTGPHTISQQDAKDVNKYRAAKEAATKAGVQLQIA